MKEWRWKFVARNGKTIAVSSEGYRDLVDCERSVEILKEEAASAPMVGDDAYKKARA